MYTTDYDIKTFGTPEALDIARLEKFLKRKKESSLIDRMITDWYPAVTASHHDVWIMNVTGGTGPLELKHRNDDYKCLYFDVEKKGKVDVYINFIGDNVEKVVIYPISRIDLDKVPIKKIEAKNNYPRREETKFSLCDNLGWTFTWSREKKTYEVTEPDWTQLLPKPFRTADVTYDPLEWERKRNNGLAELQTYLDKSDIKFNLLNGQNQ